MFPDTFRAREYENVPGGQTHLTPVTGTNQAIELNLPHSKPKTTTGLIRCLLDWSVLIRPMLITFSEEELFLKILQSQVTDIQLESQETDN